MTWFFGGICFTGDIWLKILSALKTDVLWNTIISIYMFKLFFGLNAFQV